MDRRRHYSEKLHNLVDGLAAAAPLRIPVVEGILQMTEELFDACVTAAVALNSDPYTIWIQMRSAAFDMVDAELNAMEREFCRIWKSKHETVPFPLPELLR